MGNIKQKLVTIKEALETLRDSIDLFHEQKGIVETDPVPKNEKIFLAMRDSVIQRFEYCTDLFWKMLKVYLEEVEKVVLTTNSPRGIIREAVKVKTLSEDEGEECIDMVTSRNQTSHIYHEEIAEDIAGKVPKYYELMERVVERVHAKTL